MRKYKKGVSNIIVVILLILLVLALIVILWWFLRGMLKEQGEIAEAKADLIDMGVDIGKVNISEATGKVNVTISRGPGRMVLKNVTVIEQKGDIVFLIDSTGSMLNEINDVKSTITSFADKLSVEGIDYRLALIEFRDYPTGRCGISGYDFPSKIYSFTEGSFTTNIVEYKSKIDTITTVGSGLDLAESHLTALDDSLDLLYREDAKKFNIMLTDAPPHAKDCTCNPAETYPASCYNGVTFTSCYLGPETVQEVTDRLVNKEIKFYYITKEKDEDGKETVCDNRIMIDGMTSETGGKSFSYTEIQGVEQILIDLATQIIKEYEEEKYDHLKVIFYNNTDSCEQRIPLPEGGQSLPLPLETRTYELETCIESIEKIEIYPVVYTASGIQVIGPRLDSWIV